MLISALQDAESIAISGHVKPDGDCTGSSLAVYNYIKEHFPEKKVRVYLEELPDSLRFLPGADKISNCVLENEEYDLFVMLDCGEATRTGFAKDVLARSRKVVCIDHHISNVFESETKFVDPSASSTCELVFDQFDLDKITKEIATCLFTGMVTDTGVFRYSCTHPSTMRAAAALMEKGVEFSWVIHHVFDEKTYAQNQVLGKALLDSRLLMGGRAIAAYLTLQDMEEYHVKSNELDGIVSQLRVTQGVDLAIFLYENKNHAYKVSLRSTELIDVSVLAQKFGGGGHERAAGCMLEGSPQEIIEKIAQKAEEQLGQ